MVDDVRKHIETVPFMPFTIRMASGHEYPVPTLDHVWIPPGNTRVQVSDDQGLVASLPGYAISGVVSKTRDQMDVQPPAGEQR